MNKIDTRLLREIADLDVYKRQVQAIDITIYIMLYCGIRRATQCMKKIFSND